MAYSSTPEQDILSLAHSSTSSPIHGSFFLSPSTRQTSTSSASPSNHTPSSSHHDASKRRNLFPIFYGHGHTCSTTSSKHGGEDAAPLKSSVNSPRAGKKRRRLVGILSISTLACMLVFSGLGLVFK